MVLIGDAMVDVLVAELLRLHAPGNMRMSGRDNCAIVAGFEAYRENFGHFPEKYVRIGEPPTGERVDVILNKDALTVAGYGAILAASKNEGFPMPSDIKAALKEKCAKCEFGDNCYILDALGRFE